MIIELTILQVIFMGLSLFVAGGFVGMLIMALCVIAQRSDERAARELKQSSDTEF